ncbi:MAG: type II secretion system protein [Gemmatimonadaceae bacterium]
MTLLEALLALVILGLSAVGYLDVFQSSARAVQVTDEWTQAVSIAESAMEAATLGDALQAQGALGTSGRTESITGGFQRRIAVQPWRGRVHEIVVVVTTPRGVTFTLRRLAGSS